MKALLFVLGNVLVIYSQTPTPCESPKQWYGTRVLIDSSKDFAENAELFYDASNERVRSVETIELGKERDYYDVLRLHKEQKEYRVNLRNKTCNVTSLSTPFRPIGVPSDAKLLFQAEVGAASVPLEHLTAVRFFGNNTQENFVYSTTVTYPSCIPLGDEIYSNKTGQIISRYFNINVTAISEAHFTPPEICR